MQDLQHTPNCQKGTFSKCYKQSNPLEVIEKLYCTEGESINLISGVFMAY